MPIGINAQTLPFEFFYHGRILQFGRFLDFITIGNKSPNPTVLAIATAVANAQNGGFFILSPW
jgi:hypothetical protein